jgi:hypothetical protein
MSNPGPGPRFAFVSEAPAGVNASAVLRAARQRLSWPVLGWMLALIAVERLLQFSSQLHLLGNHGLGRYFTLTVWVIEVPCVVAIVLAVIVADEAVAQGAPRLRSYVLAVALGAAFGATVETLVRHRLGLLISMDALPWEQRVMQPFQVFLGFFFHGLIVSFIYLNRRTARAAAERRRRAELVRTQAQRSTFESRLQAMQARVEPQFLFNTLAQVQALYETDPTLADGMLDELIAYLRAALPHLRESTSTLGKEVELVRATSASCACAWASG